MHDDSAAAAPDVARVPSQIGEPAPRRRSLPRLLGAFLRDVFRTRLDKSRARIRVVAFGFAAIYCVVGGRLIQLGMRPDTPDTFKHVAAEAAAAARPDIIDRNGEILATDIRVMSIFAEPKRIIDKDEAVELLTAVLPDVNARELRDRLSSRKGFAWVKRGVTPKEQEEVFRLGLPGVGFLPEDKRVYPNGPIAAHVLGLTNVDNAGIAGIEKYIDDQGLGALHGAGFNLSAADMKPVRLSLDLKVTYALRDELLQGIAKYKANAAAGAILDVNTGEVIALASLPDYDPNTAAAEALDKDHINRLTVGVYEMGSTFKAISLAMALDSNKVTLNSRIDARGTLRYGRFTIHDYEAKSRVLTVPEVFTFSSNIGAARMALMVGVEAHKAFLRKMGQLDRMRTELPESAEPLYPRNWGELNTMTIAFGHGIAVAPLQAAMAVGALMNGGLMINPTFLPRTAEEARTNAPRVIRAETSEEMRYLMRLNAEKGTAQKANIPGYFVGGKTGTAEKVMFGHYQRHKLFTTFMAIVPADKPRYLFLTTYDEPKGLPETGGFATAAWNSGVVTGKIIERVGPLLGMAPRIDLPEQPFPLVAKLGIGITR
ncbi:MAG: penicillin-binding protein 2 [Methylobacteriaceae bacterium]|nr:penicillin-binding protein 2 [Methylobacteriaceae bacterium]MBV9245107.1 penicillin-binding protein 2 [Methylobacteriaceae bacterium]MBV9634171.1 penicillin-binding protein 2 [Methylobacteriaceae bacterium]